MPASIRMVSFFSPWKRRPVRDFELGPKRRWRHSEGYLRDLAGRTGFQVVGLVAATPRHEAGEPVEGFAVALAP